MSGSSPVLISLKRRTVHIWRRSRASEKAKVFRSPLKRTRLSPSLNSRRWASSRGSSPLRRRTIRFSLFLRKAISVKKLRFRCPSSEGILPSMRIVKSSSIRLLLLRNFSSLSWETLDAPRSFLRRRWRSPRNTSSSGRLSPLLRKDSFVMAKRSSRRKARRSPVTRWSVYRKLGWLRLA